MSTPLHVLPADLPGEPESWTHGGDDDGGYRGRGGAEALLPRRRELLRPRGREAVRGGGGGLRP